MLTRLLKMGHQPFAVLDHLQVPIGVDDHVVPGGYDLPGLLFFRVPGRSDVVLRTGEDRKRLDRVSELTPLRIGSRDMAFQTSHRAVLFEHHGNMRGKQAG